MFFDITYPQWHDMCIGAIIRKAGGDQVTSVVSDAALAELDNYMSGVHQPDNVADSIAVIARANGFNLLAS